MLAIILEFQVSWSVEDEKFWFVRRFRDISVQEVTPTSKILLTSIFFSFQLAEKMNDPNTRIRKALEKAL